MSINFAWITLLSAYLQLASATVTQCYHCNSQFCGDPYDSRLGAVTSCTEIYQNTQMYSNKLVDDSESVEVESIEPVSNNSDVVPIDPDNSTDIETFSNTNNTEPIGRIFDIPRKIWELFNRGEIDDTTQFVCAKAVYISDESGKTMTYRGCVPKYTRSISTACDFVNQKVAGASSGTVSSCNTCESNLCNSAFNVKSSLLGLVITIGFRVLF